jgi:pSer/pThr/pTyr-binding forkhead associated (FHA) protein
VFADCPRCQTKYLLEKADENKEFQCMKCGEVFVAVGAADDAPTQINQKDKTLLIPENKRIYLEISKGTEAGKAYQILKPVVTIGRGSQADIQLSDAAISRKHCVIEISAEQAVLRDLGSTNGTFVSGQRIDFAYLRDRGEFDLGSTTIRYIEISK